MPCTQFEALKAHCQVRCDQGVDSDKSTVKDNNADDNAEDAGDPQGEPALIETRICEDTVNMFKRAFSSAKERWKPFMTTR
jgi:hypothetical protein